MTESKRIAVCILRYLKEELGNASISEESKESLEVAIQCLESVYEVGPDDLSALAVKKTLPEMFKASTGMCFNTEQPNADSATAASAPPPPRREPPKPEAEAAKQKGNDLLKAEKYQEALEMYSMAIDLDPHNAVYFCNRAAAFSKLDKSSEAIEDCKAALAIDPTYSKAYGRMGIAYAQMGDHQKAYECYEKAIELDPNNESYRNNLRVAREQIQGSGGSVPSGGAGAASGGPAPGGFLGFPGGLGVDVSAGIAGMPDLTQLLGNPTLMNMASQMMQDPSIQNLMTNLVSETFNSGQQPPPANNQPNNQAANNQANTQANNQANTQANNQANNQSGTNQAPPGGLNFDNLLRAGQQFAQQMQTNNGPLIEQLRRQMEARGVSVPNRNNPPNNPPPSNNP